VLFQLLGMVIEQVKEVASVKDILSGESVPANQPATTTLALIDQGLKVFTSIYKRLHRSLKSEFKKIYRLNGLFLDPEVYFRFQDVPAQILQADYQADDCDILPVTDPSVVAGPVKLIKAQALMSLLGKGLNDLEIIRRFLEAIEEPNIDKIMPQPDPMAQEKAMMGLRLMALEIEKTGAEVQDLLSGVDKNIALSIKALFDAKVMDAQAAAQQVGALSESAQAGESKGASGNQTKKPAAATAS
jgi:hypothetical protein